MIEPPFPRDEKARLADLQRYDVLDTPPEEQFDDLTELAANICEAPIALISLIDEDRQWFKSRHGLEAQETERSLAFCAHAILHPETLVVEDALSDQRFSDNPLVTADPKIRFYAGAPLVSPEGHALGTLCVIDRVPRKLATDHEKALRILSRHVMAQLELRRRNREVRELREQNRHLHAEIDQQARLAVPESPLMRSRLKDAERSRLALLSILEDHQETEHRLRTSETRYRRLFEHNPAPMLIYARGSLQLLAVNEAFTRHYGYTKHEAEKLLLPDLHPLDERAEISRLAAGLHGFAEAGEWHHLTKDGARITIIASSHDSEFEGRESRIAVITDISARKAIEEALKDSEQRLRLAMQAANQGLYDLNLQTGEAVVSPEYAHMLGYDPDTFHETHVAWRARLHPDDAERAGKVFDDYFAGRTKEYRVEFRQKTKDGHWKWILSLGRIQERDAEGQPLRMLGTHTDISEQKQAEAELAERNRRIVESEAQAHMGHWWLEANSGKAWWADEIYRILGLPQNALPGPATLKQCVHPDDWASVSQSIDGTLHGGQRHDMQYRIIRPDGDTRYVRCRARLVHDEMSDTNRLLGTFQDMTELHEAQLAVERARDDLELRVQQRTAELNMANRELQTFTYSVSHDLKAPLRGIDGYSRLLIEDHLDQLDDEGRLFLQNVRTGVAQMSQLIEDLLTYSRMERQSLNDTVIDLPKLVARVLNDRQHELDARNVSVRINLDAATAHGDPDGFVLVLRNVIDNALKFTRDQGIPELEINSTATDGGVLVVVKDNGIGFDMRFHDRIFDIFQRLQRAEDYPGTGIGLAIVRKAMQRMGGRVWANSTPGQGTEFLLELQK